jgi:urocanate hydratase
VGIGKAINGGFGLVLDGSRRVDEVIRSAIAWDVMGGVARRSWAGNKSSIATAIKYNQDQKGTDQITLPFLADEKMVDVLVAQAFSKMEK